MLNVSKWSASSKLTNPIGTTDTQLKVNAGDGFKFVVPPDDYYYATLRANGVFEHVRVVAVDSDTLVVQRGQDNTVAQSFPANTCIVVEWNPAQLCEYVKQCALNETPTGVIPGTYCMSCDTCFEIGADGRIKAVNGSTQCP